ncbi:D-arabinose 5-phosphate isomerase [Ventosimonas gracilis]|uniref:Arabinose 5-phosphate isomerase n=1 Tax=Ventosimonas gracilis TaxID=1680762 RepID=A0A139SS16_9GAMM|nr:KpsF/GutQ family sugar-phosphate isomerase [Ventosimonas gracilis]KXU37304.1 D-arabinose 5-phosphate isomerase [Ventosimonas gracilis]
MTALHSLIQSATRTLSLEITALQDLLPRLGEDFVRACELMLACSGRVVVVGMGKSGHIGKKIAATLASTGTPAFFVHPAEASHGDMGMLTTEDLVLALSNSGSTAEILTLLPLIKRLGIPLVSMTGRADSPLAEAAEVNLDAAVRQEACPLQLAPTASTTAALALGDALAVALMEARGFTAEQFALSHPGGALGKRLLLRASDLMHSGERLPLVAHHANLQQALLEMSSKGLGMTCVLDDDGRLAGIFTDGDLRRAFEREVDLRNARIASLMSKDPRVAQPAMLAAEVLHLMQAHKINALVVVDADNRPLGALNMHDLLRAGVI